MDTPVTDEKKIHHRIGSIIDRDRVLGFSDGVFAFASTLLVLKIDLPAVTAGQLTNDFWQMFLPLAPQYIANIISFLIIGYYWINHHAIFSLVQRYNSTVVWLNIFFLVFLSFLPFPVDLYGENFMVPNVVVFYSASLAIVGLMLAIIWFYASHNYRLVSDSLSKKQINYYMVRNLVAPIVFVGAIPLVYVHPILAQLSWIMVIVGVFIVNKIFKARDLSAVDKDSV